MCFDNFRKEKIRQFICIITTKHSPKSDNYVLKISFHNGTTKTGKLFMSFPSLLIFRYILSIFLRLPRKLSSKVDNGINKIH